MCGKRNFAELSCQHCYRGKARITTYSEFVFIALSTQSEIRMRHIFICDLPDYTLFLHYLIIGMIFGKKKSY